MKKLGGCPFQAFTHKNRILLRKNERCIGNRKMKFWYVNTLFLWVLFAVLVLAPTTLGEVILFTSDSATQKLYAVDPTTGTSTSVGDFGVGGAWQALLMIQLMMFYTRTGYNSAVRLRRSGCGAKRQTISV